MNRTANPVLIALVLALHIPVRADSGGPFRTTDGGLRWTHVKELDVTFTQDVAYVSSTVILVSAKADFRTANARGGAGGGAGDGTRRLAASGEVGT